MLNLEPGNIGNQLQLVTDTNRYIDFCIWVLQQDGLHVAPFSFHSGRNQLLQAAGLNADTWRSWCAKVLATKDQRLGGTTDPQVQQMKIEEQIASLETLASFSNRTLDLAAIRRSLEKSMEWQARQYEEALEHLGQYSRESTPPEVWSGEPKIGQMLGELWQEYLSELEYDSDEEYGQEQQFETTNQLQFNFR
jgi:hypothetical protein